MTLGTELVTLRGVRACRLGLGLGQAYPESEQNERDDQKVFHRFLFFWMLNILALRCDLLEVVGHVDQGESDYPFIPPFGTPGINKPQVPGDVLPVKPQSQAGREGDLLGNCWGLRWIDIVIWALGMFVCQIQDSHSQRERLDFPTSPPREKSQGVLGPVP